MRILVIGSGGREHALCFKLAQSKLVSKVFVAPGNAGTAHETKVTNVNIAVDAIDSLVNFVKTNQINITLVGPELPLSLGIVDIFRAHNLKIWGPTQYCAQLESSKSFAKDFMTQFKIPTANYKTFTDAISANEYLHQQKLPIVIKADGLASGKGVLVTSDIHEASTFINDIFNNNKFGNAGDKVVIEEFLTGTEVSFIVMLDNGNIVPLASSQDHKRLLDKNIGPNTGGMGAFSPSPIMTEELHQRVTKEIIQPVIDGFKQLGHEYSGFLYAGLMIDEDGNPKTLEFNCRLGDPETQPLLMRLESDFAKLILDGVDHKLDQVRLKWYDGFSIGVVVASDGYPNNPRSGDIITNCEQLGSLPNIKIFHAGTTIHNGRLVTNGGRILCVTGLGNSLASARNNTYQAVKKIHFMGMQYRKDIGN